MAFSSLECWLFDSQLALMWILYPIWAIGSPSNKWHELHNQNSHMPLLKQRKWRDGEVMCGASGSLGLWNDPLGVSNPEQAPFPWILPHFSPPSTCLCQRLAPLLLLFCMYIQLLWECTNPHGFCIRQRQGKGGLEKPGVSEKTSLARRSHCQCIIGKYLNKAWPLSGPDQRRSQFLA